MIWIFIFLCMLFAVGMVAAIWSLRDVKKDFEKKYIHQESQLYQAHLVNQRARANRDAWRLKAMELEKSQYIYNRNQSPESNQFTSEEINVLIQLCHPDKHGGRDIASNITAKLIKIRKENRSC